MEKEIQRQHVCKACCSEQFALKEKGTQTGLYCEKCDQWVKWVSKRDIAVLIAKYNIIDRRGIESPIQYAITAQSIIKSLENECQDNIMTLGLLSKLKNQVDSMEERLFDYKTAIENLGFKREK